MPTEHNPPLPPPPPPPHREQPSAADAAGFSDDEDLSLSTTDPIATTGLAPRAFYHYYHDQSKFDPKDKMRYVIMMYVDVVNSRLTKEHESRMPGSSQPAPTI